MELKRNICKNETSLWLANTPLTDYEQLPDGGNIEVDVSVVGAGIAGITTALLLKKSGLKVALIDSERVATGVSGYTTGKITAQHIVIYNYLIKKFGIRLAKQYADANIEAIAVMKKLINDYDIDCDFFEKIAYTYEEKDIYSFRSQPYMDSALIIASGQEHVTGQIEDTMERFLLLYNYVKQFFDIDHIEFCWSSQDNNTFDMVPYIGKYLPASKHLFIATGFNGWGMTHGTISAMIIKDMITGVKNPRSDVYDPSRFKLLKNSKIPVQKKAAAIQILEKGKIRLLFEIKLS